MSEGIKTQEQLVQSFWSALTYSLRSKQTVWLAVMLAFLVPTIAAGAWYASSDTSQPSESVEATSSIHAAIGSEDDTSKPAATETATGVHMSATTSSSTADGGAKTEVTVNGKKVEIPSGGGSVSTHIENEAGSSNVSISVDSQQSNAGSSYGSNSTSVHSNSSTYTNSNNTTSTSFFNSFSSSP